MAPPASSRTGSPIAAGRRSPNLRRSLAVEAPLACCDGAVDDQRQQSRGNRAEQDQVGAGEREPPIDELPEAAGPDEGGERRDADADDGGRPDPGDHDRHRQRKLDEQQPLPGGHSDPTRRLHRLRGHSLESGERVAHDRQQRVERQRDDRRRGADLPDQRQQDDEHGQARNRLQDADHPGHEPAETRRAGRHDSQRYAEQDRDAGGDTGEHQVLPDAQPQFAPALGDQIDPRPHYSRSP